MSTTYYSLEPITIEELMRRSGWKLHPNSPTDFKDGVVLSDGRDCLHVVETVEPGTESTFVEVDRYGRNRPEGLLDHFEHIDEQELLESLEEDEDEYDVLRDMRNNL